MVRLKIAKSKLNKIILLNYPKNVGIQIFSYSVFPRIRTEYGDLLLDLIRKSPNTGKYGAEKALYSVIF